MSFQTWLHEFYPQPAARMTDRRGLTFDLRTWRGALPESLKKHGCYLSYGEVHDRSRDSLRFLFGYTSSSLCLSHYGAGGCAGCPLVKVRGVSCAVAIVENESPYWHFIHKNSPGPMIELIKQAIQEDACAVDR